MAAPCEPGGAPVWLAWVDPSTLLRASGLRGWGSRRCGWGCGDWMRFLNEAECPEFIHEKIDPGTRCANHFRQLLLRYFGKHLLRLGFCAIASEQQENPS